MHMRASLAARVPAHHARVPCIVAHQPCPAAGVTAQAREPLLRDHDLEESFVVNAPPGKLGLAMTMVESGEFAVVHAVRPASPLKEQIRKGDRVVAVDGEDTSTYTHDQLVKLILDKQGAPRVISVRRL